MGNQCAKHLVPACKGKQPAAESDSDPDVDDTADVEWHGDVDDASGGALALDDDDPDVKTFDESVKARTERLIENLAKEVTAEAGAGRNGGAGTGTGRTDVRGAQGRDDDVAGAGAGQGGGAGDFGVQGGGVGGRAPAGPGVGYFERSMAVLEFCRVLDGCIRQARENQMIIQVALNMMPVPVAEPGAPGVRVVEGAALEPAAASAAEQAQAQAQPSEEVVRAVLRELDNFLQAPHPFSDAFSTQFRTLYAEHVQMQHKLQQKKRQLDKRLRRVRAWSKVSSIMLAATAAAVLICAVVVAAVLAPPAAAAAPAGSLLPAALQPPVALESVGRWVRSAWARYEAQLGRARGVADAAHRGAYVAVRDLDTIRALVQRLRDGLASVRRTVAFAAARGDEAAAVAVAEVRRKQARFVRELEELAEQVGVCERFIRRARGVVLHNLMMPPPPQEQQQQESSSKPY